MAPLLSRKLNGQCCALPPAGAVGEVGKVLHRRRASRRTPTVTKCCRTCRSTSANWRVMVLPGVRQIGVGGSLRPVL